MTRIDIINFLIKENNYKSYIEIGVEFGCWCYTEDRKRKRNTYR